MWLQPRMRVRIVRNHGVSPKLFNASSDEIAVEGLVDIEFVLSWAGDHFARSDCGTCWVSLVAACLKDGKASGLRVSSSALLQPGS